MGFLRESRATRPRGASRLAIVRPEQRPNGQGASAGPIEPEAAAALVEALRMRSPGAAERFYDAYVDLVHGLLFRLLGPDPELEDTFQEVLIAVLMSIGQLRDPTLLTKWVIGITVRSVKNVFRRRRRRRWLVFLPSEELPEPRLEGNDNHRDAIRDVFKLLDQLPAEERIALVLHRVEGMSLSESAAASGMSLATFKRRLARGESRFFAAAEQHPGLGTWLEGERNPC